MRRVGVGGGREGQLVGGQTPSPGQHTTAATLQLNPPARPPTCVLDGHHRRHATATIPAMLQLYLDLHAPVLWMATTAAMSSSLGVQPLRRMAL